MEELLIAILQFLFEFILNILSNTTLDWPLKHRTTQEPEKIAGRCFLWLFGGFLFAFISLLVVPYTVISLPALRIANLVLAPICSAYLSKAIATYRAEKNSFIVPRNHFWQAFWFTVGLVIIRFMYASRV